MHNHWECVKPFIQFPPYKCLLWCRTPDVVDRWWPLSKHTVVRHNRRLSRYCDVDGWVHTRHMCGKLSQWSSGNTLACGARGPRFASRCGQKFVFSRKSLRYAALGTGCTLTAVLRSTQPFTLRGTINEYQPYGCVIIHGDGRMFGF